MVLTIGDQKNGGHKNGYGCRVKMKAGKQVAP